MEMSAQHWVFGYGSLMWRPGFDYEERREAVLYGAHRRLCIYSHFHRGTPERPGLVLGLDRGGSCRGIAYRVAAADYTAVLDYLRGREQVTGVYREVTRRVRLLGEPDRFVHALCYVPDPSHAQYAGRLDPEEQIRIVAQGIGNSGPNPDYVASAVSHLASLGISDPVLAAVDAGVRTVLSAIGSGDGRAPDCIARSA